MLSEQPKEHSSAGEDIIHETRVTKDEGDVVNGGKACLPALMT